uniref:TTI1 C-terminal TPR domain-containing protein n=1 Tax=Bigelowiella natans TaxID=227086 RepID=A0A7S2P3C1_BIGNA|mmetsp:Transcript_1004/g.1558  ORF Transcript_1004/g.1558 Transcript_1004/m.1558 type:complete len:258 (+) Transcript_1004:206-979(+)
MALKNEERHLLPIVAQTWDSLRPHYTFNFNENISITKRHHHNLNWSHNDHRDHPDHALLANVRILESALKVLETLGKLCPAFLTQRFAEHVWPGLRKLLLYSQGNLRMKSSLNSSALNLSSATITLRQKREQQHDIDFKIQMAILNALEMLVLHAPELAVRVLPDILETVATYIVGTRTLPSSSTALSKLPREISDAAHQVLVAVGCVDADLVWWHFQDHLSIGNDSNDKECSQNVAIDNFLVKIDLVGEQESSESR